jgi:hypothetical protein
VRNVEVGDGHVLHQPWCQHPHLQKSEFQQHDSLTFDRDGLGGDFLVIHPFKIPCFGFLPYQVPPMWTWEVQARRLQFTNRFSCADTHEVCQEIKRQAFLRSGL